MINLLASLSWHVIAIVWKGINSPAKGCLAQGSIEINITNTLNDGHEDEVDAVKKTTITCFPSRPYEFEYFGFHLFICRKQKMLSLNFHFVISSPTYLIFIQPLCVIQNKRLSHPHSTIPSSSFTRSLILTQPHSHPHLNHWGRVTHIFANKITTIGTDDCLSPFRRQDIVWINAWIELIGFLETNFGEILIRIQTFSFKKMHFKMSSAKWRPFCHCLHFALIHTQSLPHPHSTSPSSSLNLSYPHSTNLSYSGILHPHSTIISPSLKHSPLMSNSFEAISKPAQR